MKNERNKKPCRDCAFWEFIDITKVQGCQDINKTIQHGSHNMAIQNGKCSKHNCHMTGGIAPNCFDHKVHAMKKAYIAGKITNDPDYRDKFAYVTEYLKSRGYAVMSPAVMPDGFEYEDYMHVCFAMMHVCRTGTIFMLPNWKESPGAMREHDNAEKLGMKIEYLTWADMCP